MTTTLDRRTEPDAGTGPLGPPPYPGIPAIVDGGSVFMHSPLEDAEAIRASLPQAAHAEILARGIRVTALDTAALARRHAPRPELTARMQGVALVGVFLRLSPFAERQGLTGDALFESLRGVLPRSVGKRGGAVVDASVAVIRDAYASLLDITAAIGVPTPAAPTTSSEVPA